MGLGRVWLHPQAVKLLIHVEPRDEKFYPQVTIKNKRILALMTLDAKQTLPKEKRICKRREFLYVQKRGLWAFGRFVSLAGRSSTVGKVGFSVSKKVGNACIRNTVKRRLRHIARTNQVIFHDKNLVIVAKPRAKEASFKQLSSDLMRTIKQLHNIKNKSYIKKTSMKNRPPAL